MNTNTEFVSGSTVSQPINHPQQLNGKNTSVVDTRNASCGEQRDIDYEDLLQELVTQCSALCQMRSNIAPKDCDLLQFLGEAVEEGLNSVTTKVVAQVAIPALLKVINTHFYKQYATRRFDRYIIKMASCDDSDKEHKHAFSCVSTFDFKLLCGLRDEAIAQKGSSPIPTVNPTYVAKGRLSRASSLDILLDDDNNIVGTVRDVLARMSVSTESKSSELVMNGNLVELSDDVTYSYCFVAGYPRKYCLSCPTLISLDMEYCLVHTKQESVAAQSNLLMNSGSIEPEKVKEQLRFDFTKRARYHRAKLHAEVHKEKRAKMTVKQRNAFYRENSELVMNGLWSEVKRTYANVRAINGQLEKAQVVIEKTTSWKKWATDKMSEMIPHLCATITRWLIQPPTFLALAVDLFTIIERIAPERVKGGFYHIVYVATQFYEEILKRASIRNSARKPLTMNGKIQADDEALKNASILTIIAEFLTGKRMKSRARTTIDFAMKSGKVLRDVNTYRKAIKELVSPVIEFLGRHIKCALWTKLFGDIETSVDLAQFVLDVEAVKAYGDQEINCPEFVETLNSLWQRACKVRVLLMTTKIDAQRSQQLNYACDSLSKLRERHWVAIQRTWSPIRKTPYVVAFAGAPGCGKSDIAPLFAKEMCHPNNSNIDIGSNNLGDLIYFDPASKHKDGYRGQPIWFIDDFGQKKDTENTPLEECQYSKFISMVSGTQYPLEMAHLDQKNMFFNSPLVVMTTNTLYPKPKSVQSVEAVQRRRNMLIYVTTSKDKEVHPEEGKVHYEVLNEVTGKIELRKEDQLQYMDFHMMPSVNKDASGNCLGDPDIAALPVHGTGYSYSQMLRITVDDFNKWQRTSRVERMTAPIPDAHVFGRDANKVDFGVHFDRMNARVVPVRTPLSMNGRLEFPPEQPDEPPSATPESWLSNTMANIPGIKEILGTVSRFIGCTVTQVLRLFETEMVLIVISMILATTGMFLAAYNIWAMWKEVSDTDPIPAYAKTQFLNNVDPKIRQDLSNLLDDVDLSLREVTLQANMATTAGYDAKINKVKAGRVVSQHHVKSMTEKLKMNMGLDNNVAVEHLIYRNMRTMQWHDGKGCMQAIGVVGRWMVCNGHFFQIAEFSGRIKEGFCELELAQNGVPQWRGYLNMQDVTFLQDDVAIFKLPPQCGNFRDIRKHFIRETQFGKTNGVSVRMLTAYKYLRSSMTTARLYNQEVSYHLDKHPNVVAKVARYYEMALTDFSFGDCGGPMIVVHLNKIAGIHAASDGIVAVSVPVYYEMFEHLTNDYEEEEPIVQTELLANCAGEVEPVGLVKRQWANFVQDNTNIRRSPVHGAVVPVTKAPSVKSLKDERIDKEEAGDIEPLYKSFDQYFEPATDIPNRILAKAYTAVSAVLMMVKPTLALGRRVLSEDEVLNGSGDGVFPALNIHTSAGMPQRTYAPGAPGKTAFFKHLLDMDTAQLRLVWQDTEAANRFKCDYERYEALLKDNTIPFTRVISQLKDETLKMEKIYKAKTRTFEVFEGPMAMIFRKYFGAFNAASIADCVSKPISVGINPHSVAWMRLYNRLNKFGGKVIAGDYQAWDKRLTAQAIYEGIKLINDWYSKERPGDEDVLEANRIRLLLAHVLIDKYVIVQRVLYQTHQGLPSGVPITSTLNSVANWLYLCSAIFSILEEKGVLMDMLPHELNDHVELALYGDDHIIALDALLREYVTFQDVQKHFRGRRVGYTDAVKSAISTFDFEDLTETTFLKRKFQPSHGYVFGPLDKSSVEDQLNWINHTPDMNNFEIFAQCFNGFAIEAHLHGKDYFDSIMARLRSALEAHVDERKEYALERLPCSDYGQFWCAYQHAYSSV